MGLSRAGWACPRPHAHAHSRRGGKNGTGERTGQLGQAGVGGRKHARSARGAGTPGKRGSSRGQQPRGKQLTPLDARSPTPWAPHPRRCLRVFCICRCQHAACSRQAAGTLLTPYGGTDSWGLRGCNVEVPTVEVWYVTCALCHNLRPCTSPCACTGTATAMHGVHTIMYTMQAAGMHRWEAQGMYSRALLCVCVY